MTTPIQEPPADPDTIEPDVLPSLDPEPTADPGLPEAPPSTQPGQAP